MMPKSDPFESIRGSSEVEERVYLEMLEPQADAETGKKYQVGDVVVFPLRKAKRWVEDTGVAKVTTEEAYEDYVAEKERRAEAFAQSQHGVYDRRIMNAPQVNANFANLANDPSAFNPNMLPRRDESAIAAAEARGRRQRQGQRSVGGSTIEQQLAALDAPQTSTPAAQTGAAGASGKSATAETKPASKPAAPAKVTDPSKADEGDDGD